MMRPEPFTREAGSGPAVVCIHANASTSGQWRELIDLLAPTHHVVAPDSYGSGQSPEWHSERFINLTHEVALLAPVFERLPSPITLVGHSYGAAVALKAALENPARVRALILYEPTLFALVDASLPRPNAADGIRNTVAAASKLLDSGDRDGAARLFIEYWMGGGAWAATPKNRRQAITDSVVNLRRWGHALFTEPAPLDAFRQLDLPILYLVGKRSPAAALAVADILMAALPKARLVVFEGLGHMGPITHPTIVNGEIKRFLAQGGH